MQRENSFIVSDLIKMSNETTFQLKKSGISQTCVSVEVDFSPIISDKKHQQSQKFPKNLLRSIPVYNNDKNHFTPSFILELDKRKCNQNKHFYSTLFQKKAEEMDQQKTQMLLPKPSKNSSVCCICRTFFQDYLTHVNLPLHKALMKKSQFHHYIEQICSKFENSLKQNSKSTSKPRQTKTKQVKKAQKNRIQN